MASRDSGDSMERDLGESQSRPNKHNLYASAVLALLVHPSPDGTVFPAEAAPDAFSTLPSYHSPADTKKRGRPTNLERLTRTRSNSVVALKDLLNRKRAREEDRMYDSILNMSFEPQPEKKKDSHLSPEASSDTAIQVISQPVSNDDIMRAINALRESTKTELNQQTDTLMLELVRRDEEMKQIMEKYESRISVLEAKVLGLPAREQVQDLVARVTKMESSAKQTESAQTVALNKKVNQMEKILKRNNAVISGLEVDEGVSLFEGVTRFLKIKFGLNNCVEEVRWLSKKPAKILVKFNDASAKRNMFENRKKLAGTNIYVDYDRTEEERQISYNIRSEVKRLREEGREVRIRGRSIVINGDAFTWSVNHSKLVPAARSRFESRSYAPTVSSLLEVACTHSYAQASGSKNAQRTNC